MPQLQTQTSEPAADAWRSAASTGACRPVTLAVDVLGGDKAPAVVLDGVAQALAKDPDLTIILTGPLEVVAPFSQAQGESCPGRIIAQPTTEFIGMDEHPAEAVRTKKDSSIVVGCRLVKEGAAQGFFSAGSTGACMAAATLLIGRAKGVSRPAIATVLPAPSHPVILTDVGANADVKPEYLLQFAQMAAVYAEHIIGIRRPRIGLLNIGEEDTKGSQLAQDAYKLLKKHLTGFTGNVEGNEILDGPFDVVVTDGFTGNVTLKTIEGVAEMLFSQLKEILTASTTRKLAAAVIMPGLKQLKATLSADAVGGAPLLGLKGSCIIGHGSSSSTAIASGIAAAARCVREDVPRIIEEAIN